MALFKYQCVYFGVETGGYTRQSRNPSSVGGFLPLNSPKNDPGTNFLQPGSSFHLPQNQYPDAQITQGGAKYDFSFINVSGLTTGGATSFNIALPPHGHVSNDPSAVLQVLVVYIPEGGPGPGGDPGAVIDAFDESAGTLFNNFFVSVSPDSNNTRYNTANVYGYVDTKDQGAGITATNAFNSLQPASINPQYVLFEKWHVLAGTAASNSGNTLALNKGQTAYALAFYNSPPKNSPDKTGVFDKHKEYIVDHLKVVGDQFIFDPGIVESEFNKINQAINRIATDVEILKGRSFIREQDRPDVGRSTARNEE